MCRETERRNRKTDTYTETDRHTYPEVEADTQKEKDKRETDRGGASKWDPDMSYSFWVEMETSGAEDVAGWWSVCLACSRPWVLSPVPCKASEEMHACHLST